MARSQLNVSLGLITKDFERKLKSVNRKLRGFQREIGDIGRNLTTSVTLPIAAVGTVAVKTFADFELSMAKVAAVSGATARAFESLKDSALELGRTTQFTASQVSGLQLNLSKLGFNPTEINQSTAAILDLALATGEDLADSATVAASTLRGFGLDAAEMIRVTDLMADSFSSSALDLEKFKVAMAVVAPVANVAGASIEETTALLGVLVNQGVDASSAGAALRNIFLDIADKGLTLEEAMDRVKNSTNPLSTAMELFGKRGATVATIMANNRDEISKLTKDFQDSRGEARKMAEIMENTLAGSFEKLKSAVEGAGISMGGLLAPAIRGIADNINSAVSTFNNLDDSTKKVIIRIAGFAAALGPALFGISKLIALRRGVNAALLVMNTSFQTTIGKLVQVNKATGKVSTNFKSLLSPQLIAIAAVIGVVSLAWGEFKRKVDAANAGVNAVKKITVEANQAVADQSAEVTKLVTQIRSENTSRKEKVRLINDLKKTNPEYFSQLDAEKATINEVVGAYDAYIDQLVKTEQLKLVSRDLAQVNLEISTFNDNIKEAGKPGAFDFFKSFVLGGGQAGGVARELADSIGGNLELAETTLVNKKDSLTKLLEELAKDVDTKVPPFRPTVDINKTDIEGAAKVFIDTWQDVVSDNELSVDLGFDITSGGLPSLEESFSDSPLLRQNAALKTYREQLSLAVDSAKRFGSEGVDLLNEKLNFTKQFIDQAATATSEYSPEVAALTEQYNLLQTELVAFNAEQDLQNQKMKDLEAIAGAAGTAFASSLEEAISSAKSFGDALKGAFLGAIDAIIKVGVATAITNTLKGPSGKLGPIGVAIAGAAGVAASALFKKLVGAAGLAEGGIIPSGFPNDTFPALLSSGEAVIPLDRLGSLTGMGEGREVYIPDLTLRGEDLIIAFNRAQKNYSRFS